MNHKITILHILGSHKKGVVGIILLIVLSAILGALPMKLIERIVNFAVDEQIKNFQPILQSSLLYIALFVGWSYSRYLLSMTSSRIEQASGHSIRLMLTEHILHTKPKFFQQHKQSDLASAIMKDSEFVSGKFLSPITYIVDAIMQFSIGFWLMMSISWNMTLFILPLGIIAALLARLTGSRIKELSADTIQSQSLMWGFFIEIVQGVSTIQIHNAWQYIFRRFSNKSQESMSTAMKEVRYTEITQGLNRLFFMVTIGIIMCVGSYFVYTKQLSIGGLTAFMMYNGILVDPVMNFIDFFIELKRTQVSIDRINQVFQAPTLPDKKTQQVTTGDITFHNVSFSYHADQVFAVKQVNLCIQEGSKVAIVGSTGSGKSTLLKLLTGLWEPTVGHITIGDTLLDQSNSEAYRTRMTTCLQDQFFFNDTLKNNLLVAHSKASDKEIKQAALSASLQEVLQNLAHGIDTEIGDDGNKLSEGERQRASIARLFLRNCPIVLLDEITSSLDVATESQVLQSVLQHFATATCIMVTHRFSAAMLFERIIVVKNGCIVGDGMHHELLHTCPAYKELYDYQVEKEKST